MAPIFLKVKDTFSNNFQPFADLSNTEELERTWKICTKAKDALENGNRLENLSWRLWHRHQVQCRGSGRKVVGLSEGMVNVLDRTEIKRMPLKSATATTTDSSTTKVKENEVPKSTSSTLPVAAKAVERDDASKYTAAAAAQQSYTPTSTYIPPQYTTTPSSLRYQDTTLNTLSNTSSSSSSNVVGNAVTGNASTSVVGNASTNVVGNPTHTNPFSMYTSPFSAHSPLFQPFSTFTPNPHTLPENLITPTDFLSSCGSDLGLFGSNYPPTPFGFDYLQVGGLTSSIMFPTLPAHGGSNTQPMETTNYTNLYTAHTTVPNPECGNCGVTHTPLWRRNVNDELLCNACGLYYKLHDKHRVKPKVREEKVKSDVPALRCANCETRNTPLWRRDGDGNCLCNACGLYLKLHHEHRPLSLKTDTIRKRHRYANYEEGGERRGRKKASAAAAASTAAATTTTSSVVGL